MLQIKTDSRLINAAYHTASAGLNICRKRARVHIFHATLCDKLNSPMARNSRRLIVILLGLAALQAAAQAPSKPAPNVVLITIDTLRADHVGCYGYQQIKTPNIDALAADGVRFERAFAVVPVTLPSHTSMLMEPIPC